jgi:hypothetical protein
MPARSIRLRHSVSILEILAVVLAAGVFACGDDKAPPAQTVFWFGLGPARGATCSSAKNYRFPGDDAQQVIIGNGVGARLADGKDGYVDCSVTASAGGKFDVRTHLEAGEIGNFTAQGSVDATSGTLQVALVGEGFSLAQSDCSAKVEKVLSGAIWVSDLQCPLMKDMSSPGISCVGSGGIIFENCAR